MNKFTIAIIASLLIGSAGTTLAGEQHGEFSKKGHGQRHGMQITPPVDRFVRAIRRLDLNETQEDEIRAIVKNLREQVRPIREEVKAGHEQLKGLIKADTYDEEAVADLALQEGNLVAEIIVITGKAMSEALGQLTEEQLDELNAMAEQRTERRDKRRQRQPVES